MVLFRLQNAPHAPHASPDAAEVQRLKVSCLESILAAMYGNFGIGAWSIPHAFCSSMPPLTRRCDMV